MEKDLIKTGDYAIKANVSQIFRISFIARKEVEERTSSRDGGENTKGAISFSGGAEQNYLDFTQEKRAKSQLFGREAPVFFEEILPI